MAVLELSGVAARLQEVAAQAATKTDLAITGGLRGGAPPVGEAKPSPRPEDDPTRNVLLRDDVLALLEQALLYEGYRLETAEVKAYREPPLKYHRVHVLAAQYSALLQVDLAQLRDEADTNRLVYRFDSIFLPVVKRLFLFGQAAADGKTEASLRLAANYFTRDGRIERAQFFGQADVDLLQTTPTLSERSSSVLQMLGLGIQSPEAGPPAFSDDGAVVILARLANANAVGAKAYFKELVQRLQLPWGGAQIADVWTGDALADARKLFAWLAERAPYQAGAPKAGYAPLGFLLELLIEDGADKRYLQELMVKFRLVPGEQINALRKGFGLEA